ncbi:MAG: helix-turn-helix domain-containing protein [Polyangiaceae bacterium]
MTRPSRSPEKPGAEPTSAAESPMERKILEASVRLFSAYGLRKTSMEQVAHEANVAKATLYSYFANKEILFAGVCAHVASELQAAAERAAAQEAAPAHAVRASLCAKFTRLHRIVHASTHAAELLETSNRVSGQVLRDAHDAYVEHLTALLAGCMDARKPARRELAETLDAAAEGIAARAADERDVVRRLGSVVDAMLARPVAPDAASPARPRGRPDVR